MSDAGDGWTDPSTRLTSINPPSPAVRDGASVRNSGTFIDYE
jgi:hypothetical protein